MTNEERIIELLESIDRKLDVVAGAIVATKMDEGEGLDIETFVDDVHRAAEYLDKEINAPPR